MILDSVWGWLRLCNNILFSSKEVQNNPRATVIPCGKSTQTWKQSQVVNYKVRLYFVIYLSTMYFTWVEQIENNFTLVHLKHNYYLISILNFQNGAKVKSITSRWCCANVLSMSLTDNKGESFRLVLLYRW